MRRGGSSQTGLSKAREGEASGKTKVLDVTRKRAYSRIFIGKMDNWKVWSFVTWNLDYSATSAGTGCQKLGVFTWQARGRFSQKLGIFQRQVLGR